MEDEKTQALMSAFGFTQEDFQANRSGKLSASQQAEAQRSIRQKWTVALVAIPVLIGGLAVVISALSASRYAELSRSALAFIIGAVVLAVVLIPRTEALSRVKTVTGEVRYQEQRFLDEGKLYFNLGGTFIMASVNPGANIEGFAAPEWTLLQPDTQYRAYCRSIGTRTTGNISTDSDSGTAVIHRLLSIEVLSTPPAGGNVVTPI